MGVDVSHRGVVFAIDGDVDSEEARRHWNGKATPTLDRLTATAPGLRLGVSEVPVPENESRRGPVGRVQDELFLRGTTPAYVIPKAHSLRATLVAAIRRATRRS